MASKKTAPPALPKQFQPLLAQAQAQGQLRYGAQEAGLQGLLSDTGRQYQQQALAQEGAFRSLLGSLNTAGVRQDQAYTDAGLTPELRGQIANSPDGQRLAASLARAQGGILQQQLGAQEGRQFQMQKLGDDYRTDVGKITAQQQALLGEHGLYNQTALEGLIGDNRAARSKLNADARQRQADADAAAQAQNASLRNAYIGQGVDIGPDGKFNALPGGKADPNAPANNPKPKSTWLPQGGQNTAKAAISKAVAQAKRLVAEGRTRSEAAKLLTEGRPGQQVVDGKGNKINVPGVPSFQELYASIALDLAFDKHISKRNVQNLHTARIKVAPLGYSTKAPPKQTEPAATPTGVFGGINAPTIG